MSELEIKSESVTLVKWKLSNFSTIAARNAPKKRLYSSIFELDSSAIECFLDFQPTTIHGEDKNYSSLFLWVIGFAGQSSVKLRLCFWIENELGKKIQETVGKYF